MKKIFLVFIILVFGKSFAIVGLADWQCKTSYGNTFDNYSGNGITLSAQTKNDVIQFKDLKKWYFYKGFIIGENYNENKLSYFFVDEENQEVFKFDKLQAATKFKIFKNLSPVIWTRWYNDDFESNFLFFLCNAFIVVFLMYHFISILFKLIKKKKIQYSRSELKIYTMLFIVFLIVTFLDINKNSF